MALGCTIESPAPAWCGVGEPDLDPTGIDPVVGEGSLEGSIALPPAQAPPRESTRHQVWRLLWELLHDLSVAVLFCFFLITFVAQAFRVQGTSMEPLLHDGQRIVVNKFIYRFHGVERGDVVVFWYPRDPSVSFIKRVVALPGDTIEIRRGVVYVNGQKVEEDYLKPGFRDDYTLPPRPVNSGYYFVLGDHRSSSNDSRNWGEVPERYIYGKAFFRFWPLTEAGFIR
jgi:signal peptidase I